MKKIRNSILVLVLFALALSFIGCQNPSSPSNSTKPTGTTNHDSSSTDSIILDVSQTNASAVFKTAIGAYPTDNKQVKTVTYTFKANQENVDIYPYIKTGDVMNGTVDWNSAKYAKFGNYDREDKNTKTTWQTVTVDVAAAVANTTEASTDYKVLYNDNGFDSTKSLVQVGFELYKDAGSAIDELTVEVKNFVVTYADDTTFELKKDNVQVETGWGGDSSLTATLR